MMHNSLFFLLNCKQLRLINSQVVSHQPIITENFEIVIYM